MKTIQSIKIAMTAAFLFASILGQPLLAHAEESGTGGGGGVIIDFDIIDAAVPSTEADGDHDVIDDGSDDLMPPPKSAN